MFPVRPFSPVLCNGVDMNKKRLCVCAVFILCICSCLFCQTASSPDLLPGLEAYAREDWVTAVMFFKKAVAYKKGVPSDALYWLILSEMSAGNYHAALDGCNSFISTYKDSSRMGEVSYQRGRALYVLQENEESIKQLYDFVKAYPKHDKVSAALFWIAESLYGFKNYERAALFYTMVIEEYPSSPKREASAYRLELIEQRGREDELLKLLNVTHEESLRAAEEYEKKSRNYEQAIQAYQKRIAELEAQLAQ